jgi:hypothetical protein
LNEKFIGGHIVAIVQYIGIGDFIVRMFLLVYLYEAIDLVGRRVGLRFRGRAPNDDAAPELADNASSVRLDNVSFAEAVGIRSGLVER